MPKIIELTLERGTKVRIKNGPCFYSQRLELQESESEYAGKEGYCGSARLADDGLLYYPISFDNNTGTGTLLVPSSNLERV